MKLSLIHGSFDTFVSVYAVYSCDQNIEHYFVTAVSQTGRLDQCNTGCICEGNTTKNTNDETVVNSWQNTMNRVHGEPKWRDNFTACRFID